MKKLLIALNYGPLLNRLFEVSVVEFISQFQGYDLYTQMVDTVKPLISKITAVYRFYRLVKSEKTNGL